MYFTRVTPMPNSIKEGRKMNRLVAILKFAKSTGPKTPARMIEEAKSAIEPKKDARNIVEDCFSR